MTTLRRTAHGVRTRETARAHRGQDGFSIVELVVAILILAIGVLGLAGTTALVIRQVTLSDVNTERAAALQSVIEQIRSTPYAMVAPGSRSVGEFDVAWSIVDSTGQTRTIRVVTQGPGLETDSVALPTLSRNVHDTFSFTVLRP